MPISPPSIIGVISYQGTWDANTNTPTLASGVGVKGHFYVVSVSGSTNLDGLSAWNVGDWAIFNGSTWGQVDGGASEVLSVAGRTGVVVLLSGDLTDLGTGVLGALTTGTQVSNGFIVAGGSGSIQSPNNLLEDQSDMASIHLNNRLLYASDGSTTNVDWENSLLYNAGTPITGVIAQDGSGWRAALGSDISALIYTSDTSHFVDGTGAFQTISSIAASQKVVTSSTPTTGQTVNAAGVHQDELLYIQPAGTLLALTVQLEPGGGVVADIGDVKEIFLSQIITGLTVAASGGTVRGTTLTTSSAVNGSYEYIKVTSTDWLRIR